MNREEAIKIFNTVLLFGKCDCPKEEIEECLKMAIKALKQEPKIGHWDKDGACPFCGYFQQWKDDAFCGHCGAQLGKVEE